MPIQEKDIQRNGLMKLTRRLKFLSAREIYLIDDLLESVGDFGEVSLEVKNGRLRFASRTESVDAFSRDRVDRK